jgi:hypothetical protein
MSVIQQDHHYVPRFLLKKWCDINDGKMWWYRKVYNGKIVEKRINPRSTYYEPNLNSLKTSPPPFGSVTDNIINLVEEKLMRIDSDSAIILNKMLNDGITSLSQKEKNTWLQFIVLLGERNPRMENLRFNRYTY